MNKRGFTKEEFQVSSSRFIQTLPSREEPPTFQNYIWEDDKIWDDRYVWRES